MMLCVLVRLLFAALLTDSLVLLPPADESRGGAAEPPCPAPWLQSGQRCFAFFPVWSSWSTASSLCAQTGAHIMSLHTPEEKELILKLANTNTPVWLFAHKQQNGSWLWNDSSPFKSDTWTNQRLPMRGVGGACMEMTPKNGELRSAPCGDLKFYICSAPVSSPSFSNKKTLADPGTAPGVSLFDVVWGYSESLAEETLHSSLFLRELQSGHLTERCSSSFMQQEALYLHMVGRTLEALISRLQEADDMKPLLVDTLKAYSSIDQRLLASAPPRWLLWSLQSFHSVVLEEPVYWLVALSARACLRDFLARELQIGSQRPGSWAEARYQEWREDSLKEAAWVHRFRQLIEDHQHQMDTFKAVNIFRCHMMNQKSLHKSVTCGVEEEEEEEARR